MFIIGRNEEKKTLNELLHSKRPEFVAVYGRRRVGKTYLIKEFFGEKFSFYTTGVNGKATKAQLKAFRQSMIEYGSDEKRMPKDWFEVFARLKSLLKREDVYREPSSNKRIVFLDEVPWMATARSDFESALDFFWNTWGSTQNDLILIVCGSATSWIIKHFLTSKRGFYNRITNKILLRPFTIKECEQLALFSDLNLSKSELLEGYLAFGGIPYYWNLMSGHCSMEQNIENLVFKENGPLHYEYDILFSSLFNNADEHLKIIDALSKKRIGLNRSELLLVKDMVGGRSLTMALQELEQCGFIRKYHSFSKKEKESIYQLIDPFIWFAKSIQSSGHSSYKSFKNTPEYYSWRGLSFEILCLNHIQQIKKCLEIFGVETNEFSWRNKNCQIDLAIDRKDEIINICEIKCTDNEFVIDSEYDKKLRNKLEEFSLETKTKKALSLTLISSNGIKENKYSGAIRNVITLQNILDS